MNGSQIRERRKKLNLTQQQLADISGVPLGTIARLESQNAVVSKVDVINKLEKAFSTNAEIMKDNLDSNSIQEAESIDLLEKDNNQIPMFNFPASAGAVELYGNPNDVKIVGYLNIPGAHKDSFALPAYGHSMYPTIANGDWAVNRPILDITEIVWGEIYYIEWADYKMYKRLLHADNEDEVILWSDNQTEMIGNRPKYSPITIKKEKIRKLCIVTEILKKPNY